MNAAEWWPSQSCTWPAFKPPSPAHPLGADELGRDTLTRLLYGSRITLLITLGAVALSMLFYLGAYFDPRSYTKGAAGDWAAKVDGQSISRDEFLVVARRQDEYYRRMFAAHCPTSCRSTPITVMCVCLSIVTSMPGGMSNTAACE